MSGFARRLRRRGFQLHLRRQPGTRPERQTTPLFESNPELIEILEAYIGVIQKGRKLIYVNAFCDDIPVSCIPSTVLVQIADFVGPIPNAERRPRIVLRQLSYRADCGERRGRCGKQQRRWLGIKLLRC